MQVLLTLDEVEDYLADLTADDPEYASLIFLRRLYYLQAEGFIALEGDRCYPS